MELYKLTDKNMQTYNGFQWKLGETRETSGIGPLCGPGWLHAYTDPLLAVFLNPIHANIDKPRLFECKGEVGRKNYGLKVGCTALSLTKEINVPDVTIAQRVTFGILCSLVNYDDPIYKKWAHEWLTGLDRTVVWNPKVAVTRATNAAYSAAHAAAHTSAYTAIRAAANAVVHAVTDAALDVTKEPLNLISLAQRAMEVTNAN